MVEKWAPEGKPVADKMVAVEYGGASHAGVTKAAKVPAEMAPAKATSVATMHGGRTQSRAGRNNRHGRQCYRYFTHHHAHSICLLRGAPQPLRRSAVVIELERAALLLNVPAAESEFQRSK